LRSKTSKAFPLIKVDSKKLQSRFLLVTIYLQSAGADGNLSEFKIIKTLFTRFTGFGVYYSDQRQTQRIGIIPDLEAKPTILGIQQGKD
jgi:hypothetical protein